MACGSATSAGSAPSSTRRTGISIFLPLRVSGMAPHGDEGVGHVPGRVLLPQRAAQPADGLLVECAPGLEDDEQRHEEAAVGQVQVHHERGADGGVVLDHAVDLGRADAHALPVEHRVGAAADEAAPRSLTSKKSPCRHTPGKVSK